MSEILALHGPFLNLPGTQEPAIDGTNTVPAFRPRLPSIAGSAGVALEKFQRRPAEVIAGLVVAGHEFAGEAAIRRLRLNAKIHQ